MATTKPGAYIRISGYGSDGWASLAHWDGYAPLTDDHDAPFTEPTVTTIDPADQLCGDCGALLGVEAHADDCTAEPGHTTYPQYDADRCPYAKSGVGVCSHCGAYHDPQDGPDSPLGYDGTTDDSTDLSDRGGF